MTDRIIVEYEDGTTAIWSINQESDTDKLVKDIEDLLGQPDTLHC